MKCIKILESQSIMQFMILLSLKKLQIYLYKKHRRQKLNSNIKAMVVLDGTERFSSSMVTMVFTIWFSVETSNSKDFCNIACAVDSHLYTYVLMSYFKNISVVIHLFLWLINKVSNIHKRSLYFP